MIQQHPTNDQPETFSRVLRADWARNRRNHKGLLVVTLFRLAALLAKQKEKHILIWWLSIPLIGAYTVLVEWVLGIELPAKTIVGPGLAIYHGQGLVVNFRTIIGRNCSLRHNTTIGGKADKTGTYNAAPTIGDGVDIGANVVVIGGISIGSHSVLGAGTVVTKDIPAFATVVGNPARVLRSDATPRTE